MKRPLAAMLIPIMILFALSGRTAEAADSLPRDSSQIMTVPMTLDCAGMEGKVRRYAVERAYCPSASKNGIQPANTLTGSCGSIWIFIRDTGFREATFSYGFTSSLGPVAFRQLTGYWDSDSGLEGTWGDAGWMMASSYSSTRSRGTGYGLAYASLSGQVTLAWGGSCFLKNPWDWEFIS